jgi:hypothetical protein
VDDKFDSALVIDVLGRDWLPGRDTRTFVSQTHLLGVIMDGVIAERLPPSRLGSAALRGKPVRERVGSVARELGIGWRQLIQYLNTSGEYVRTPSSMISQDAANRARAHFTSSEKRLVVPSPPPTARYRARPRPGGLYENNPPTRHPLPRTRAEYEAIGISHLDNPFFSADQWEFFQQALALLNGPARSRPDLPRIGFARPNRKEPITPTDRLFLPRKFKADDVVQAKAFAHWWQGHGFTYGEIAAWLDAGLHPTEYETAGLLTDEGITPDRLYEACQHNKTRDPSTIIQVARLFSQERVYDPRLTFDRLLDDWQVIRSRRRRPHTG